MNGPDGRSKGIAFVKFETEKALLNAVENGNNTDIKGRTVNIERATGKIDKPVRESNPVGEDTLTVFVGNLSFDTDENSLRKYFKSCGDI